MASGSHRVPVEDDDDDFEMVDGPKPGQDGIGRSMHATANLERAKPKSPHKTSDLNSAAVMTREAAALNPRTKSRPSMESSSTGKSDMASSVGPPPRKTRARVASSLSRATTTSMESEDDCDDEELDEQTRAERRLVRQRNKALKQRDFDARMSTPRKRSDTNDHTHSSSHSVLSSRGLLPSPSTTPLTSRKAESTRELRSDGQKQRSSSHKQNASLPGGGNYPANGEGGLLQEQQTPGMLSKAVGWITGEDSQAKRLETAMQHITYYQRQLTSLTNENDALKSDLVGLRGTNEQFASDLREAQVKSFKELSKDSWVPMEDRVISEKLGEIHKDLEDWVDDNCISTFEDVQNLGEADQHLLLDFLRTITMVSESESLVSQIKIWEAQDLDPILLVTAVITHQMYIALFTNPFLVIDSVVGSSVPEQFSGAMKATYQALLSVNRKGANRWRAEMMRILLPKPPAGGRFDGIAPARPEILHFIRSSCEMLVSQLEASQIRVFFQADRDEATVRSSTAHMIEIWVRAAEVYLQLQTQLSTVYWPNPLEVDMVGHLFDQRYVEAHRSQAFPGHAGAASGAKHQGRAVALVVSPFVALRGNEDGERYDQERVVCKAVVKVVED